MAFPPTKHIGKTQAHLAVNHPAREYARTDDATGHRVHVNRVESFHGFMRWAVTGMFHSISVKHLGRYTGEATFRWSRKADFCLGQSRDPRQAGRLPRSPRNYLGRGESRLHVADMLVLRLCGQEQSPITEHVPVPVVRLNHACRCQCGAEHPAAPCAAYWFRVPVEGGDPR